MPRRRILTGALLPIVVASMFLVVRRGGAAECTFDPGRIRSSRELWHSLSRDAEILDVASHKRRASAPADPYNLSPRNFIDTEVFAKMSKDGIRWTTMSSDAEFLRRVSLDLAGEIPTADDVKAFTADSSRDKRDRLIDGLLASEGFTDRWTMWFGDLLENVRTSANINLTYQGRNAYYSFIRDSIASGKPYDQIVREAIAAQGTSFSAGAVNFWVRQIQTNGPIQDTYDNLAAFSGEKFLGLPLVCISCHNGRGHLESVNTSLVSRTRDEFWKNAAFFAQVTARGQRDPATNNLQYTVSDNATGAYRLNTTSGNKTTRAPAPGQPSIVEPSFFLSGEAPQSAEPRRVAFGRILTANPQFARATVNYIWKEMFGIGIVEPADSFDLLRQDSTTLPPGATLQPTHPQLLTQLATYFTSTGYNLRALIKLIAQSNTYQLSSRYTPGPWNELWTPYYARHYPRRIMSEALLDAIARATNVPVSLNVNGTGPVARAMKLPDPTEPARGNQYSALLTAFGRGDRDTTPRSHDGSIVQALEMFNDAVVTTRVRAGNRNTTVGKLIASTNDPSVIASELYIATLSRYPTAAERDAAIAYLKSGDLGRKSEDLQYALMNRLEFVFN